MTIQKKDCTCPICGKPGTWTTENTFKPFCSERCKLIDLGEWINEKRRIPDDATDPSEFPSDEEGNES